MNKKFILLFLFFAYNAYASEAEFPVIKTDNLSFEEINSISNYLIHLDNSFNFQDLYYDAKNEIEALNKILKLNEDQKNELDELLLDKDYFKKLIYKKNAELYKYFVGMTLNAKVIITNILDFIKTNLPNKKIICNYYRRFFNDLVAMSFLV